MIGPRLGSGPFDKSQLITEADGFLLRAYATVFNAIDAQQSDMHVQVRASCCEVYHEQVTCRLPLYSSTSISYLALMRSPFPYMFLHMCSIRMQTCIALPCCALLCSLQTALCGQFAKSNTGHVWLSDSTETLYQYHSLLLLLPKKLSKRVIA